MSVNFVIKVIITRKVIVQKVHHINYYERTGGGGVEGCKVIAVLFL